MQHLRTRFRKKNKKTSERFKSPLSLMCLKACRKHADLEVYWKSALEVLPASFSEKEARSASAPFGKTKKWIHSVAHI